MKFQVHIFIPSQKSIKIFVTPFNVSENFHTPLSPFPPISSVFIIVLSIFRNSPIGGNSPISCGGKRQTYPEHFP